MKIKRISIIGACVVAALAIIAGEVWLVVEHENERQRMEAGAIYDDVTLNLDMIKIAIQTSDEEVLNENVNNAKKRLEDFDKLFIAKKQDAEYINEISSYLDFINEKKSLVVETSSLKEKVLNIKSSLKEACGGEKVTKDEINTVSGKVASLKISDEEFKNESIKVVITTTNSMLDEFGGKADELAKCIGVCYKNKISEITNGLNEIVKSYSGKVDELNKNIEKEFELEKIDKIKFSRMGRRIK